MSKNIKVLECRKCGRELYRTETGEIRNPNGTYATNLELYRIEERYCFECSREKEADHGKSMRNMR